MEMRLSTQLKEDQELEECDRIVQNNPQYISEYTKDIFRHLKKEEVN